MFIGSLCAEDVDFDGIADYDCDFNVTSPELSTGISDHSAKGKISTPFIAAASSPEVIKFMSSFSSNL